MKIREHVDVIPQPTVIRLDHLREENSQWISDSYYVTRETEGHLHALRVLFEKDSGCGVFLVGHYGAGKSHFLAYLTQQLQAKTHATRNPGVAAISLVNYKAMEPLETIVERELGIAEAQTDRRNLWKKVLNKYPAGLVLVLDELSEFLRSKPTTRSFNEDLRFLQFLGEWADGRRLWIIAALQEQIEHTGEIEYDLFRKIKDRYPIRLLLTPSHIRDLIAQRILRKKPSYRAAVESLVQEFRKVYPDNAIDYAQLCEIYPLHPATLELLEEVRDRFSQARGIIDFTVKQLAGDEARGIAAFLDQPWGHLVTPNTIVDHFADLFEIQQEFLPIAQKVLPYCREQIPMLFPTKTQQNLAWRLLKLMILVHLSPRRRTLSVDDASHWLLFKASSITPEKNREIVKKALETLVHQSSYMKQEGEGYCLDLEDDSKQRLDQLVSKTVADLEHRGDALFETLVPLLEGSDFNPFSLPRDRWHMRKVRWHFHDWNMQVYFGGGAPPSQSGLLFQIGLPWGLAADGACTKIVPKTLELSLEIVELAALYELKDRPLPARVLSRIQERIAARSRWFASLVRGAYLDATVKEVTGTKAAPPLQARDAGFSAWLNAYAEWLLRSTYPLFERFAPGSGPLPKEAYRQFMKFASERDVGAPDAPEFVKLIREAYLVPMGLMQRKGAEYIMNPKLESNELVRLLAPILAHHPSPARVYEHLSAPVYGLLPDQIHLLLLVLLIQGELDILKADHSYRDAYETLTNPLQYDTVVPGHALNVNQLRNLQTLCEGFHITVPRQWSVLAQKRAIDQLRKYGRTQRDLLSAFAIKLKEYGDAGETLSQVEVLLSKWLALEKGDHELQAFQHFEVSIGSAHRFVTEANDIASLPQQFDRLLRETQRFRHLFSDPALAKAANPDIAMQVAAAQSVPPLSQPEALQAWIEKADGLYRAYIQDYRERHEYWRDQVSRHPIWSYRIPAVARSRHLVLTDFVGEVETLISRARAQRCPGLTSLEFQPFCRCGFDGSDSPLSETLRRFEETSQRLETEIGLFFQQDRVKTKFRDWVNQGLEVSSAALSYLEGRNNYPEVDNLSLFDQHLSGLELVKPVETETFLSLIVDRVWEKPALVRAIEEFFVRTGPRVVFRRSNGERPAAERELLAWCYEQALRHGYALPPAFSNSEQRLAAELIDPRWVGEESILKLEQMGIGETAVERIIDMVLKGLVHLPEKANLCGAVRAARELITPSLPARADELAGLMECLYSQHERFMRLQPERWTELLNHLAMVDLTHVPERLEAKLRSHLDAQWIVVDCFGLPLLTMVRRLLSEFLPQWKLQATDFAVVSERTSTDAFYVSLIKEEFKKSFDKIDAVDHLIHEGNSNMEDLSRRARAELEIALRKLNRRLDATKSVLIFGDHGFRLASDGRSFTHSGGSALERLTPFLLLTPFLRRI